VKNARRVLVVVAGIALTGRFLYPAPPPRTLEGLAAMLGKSIGGTVAPADIAWEPSPGVLAELFWGRRVLFLGRADPREPGGAASAAPAQGAPRDLYRARVRVTLEGRPVTIEGVNNLTGTPLGDEQKLVIRGDKAAFATSSYGKIEAITLLDLGGSAAPAGGSIVDSVTSSITNWQETGTGAGIGRLDVNLDAPLDDVHLAFDDQHLLIGTGGGKSMALEMATGTIVSDTSGGAHASTAPVLHKRPILWAVDTIRAEVGPEPVAAIEAAVFNARDLMRRTTYSIFGPSAEQADPVSPAPHVPPPQALDYSQTDTSVWPPAPIPAIWKNPEPGEGAWEPVAYPWLKKLAPDAPPYFFRTTIRPDPDRPYAKVLVVAMDMRQLELDMEAGVEDPKPLTGAHGSGKIPRDPKILNRVVGAFNGAFKTTHGEYGMMVHRRVLLPPKPAAATLVVSEDRRVGLGTWGPDPTKIPPDIVSYRQNLEPLVEDGKLLPSGRTQWGWQLNGTSMMTERTGICVTESRQLYYLWGDEVSAATLGKAMILAGCTYGMHLDMNPHHTGFVFANVRNIANKDYDVKLLTPLMEMWPERYLEYSPKDFFYLMLRDPTPAGDVAWTEDVGTQPAPTWLPAVWHAMVTSTVGRSTAGGAAANDLGPPDSQVQVELLAFDAGRVLFRIREARQEGHGHEYASTELGGEEAHRVIAAIGLGNPHDQQSAQGPKSPYSRLPPGALAADEATGLQLFSEAELASRAGKADSIDLPLILDGGKIPAPAREPRTMRRRGAACVTPTGHTVIAVATTDSDEATALALQRIGCTRAVALDRGTHRPIFLHRAGGGTPPLARYDESVLYAISRPMAPKAYRWK
jgi:hypothetical protein